MFIKIPFVTNCLNRHKGKGIYFDTVLEFMVGSSLLDHSVSQGKDESRWDICGNVTEMTTSLKESFLTENLWIYIWLCIIVNMITYDS